MFHADRAEVSIGLSDLERAVECYEEAATALESAGLAPETAKCREAIARARTQRERLLKTAGGD